MIAVGVLAVTVCLLLPSLASAGTFVAVTCHGPSGAAVGARGWSVATATGQYITYSDGCSNRGGGALGLTMGPDPSGEYYIGDGDTMTYSAPAGLTITGYSLQLDAFGGPCPIQSGPCADGLGQVYINHTGGPSYDYRNLGYGAQTTTVAASELADVTSVNVGVTCNPGLDPIHPCPGYADPEAQALVTNGTFTIQDPTVPSVTSVSGSLIAGGTLTGTNTISFTGSDSGGGVYSATVLVDGRQVLQEVPDSNEGLCVNLTPSSATMTFASPQPCPQVENISIPVDTSQFSAGTHHLQVVVTDAAGDHVTAWEGSITTSGPTIVGVNGGTITSASSTTPPPPVANGDPCAGEQLELEVNGKRGIPAIPYGQPVNVTGVLHCGTVPISHALIAVAAVGGQASDVISTSVQSAVDGSFTYKVPAGPDRDLRFSYTAYSNDPEPTVTATATIAIRPHIRLTINPHATSNGHATHWQGTITGGPLPRRGVTLDVEVQEGRRWMIFDQIVARSNGRFHYSYQFHATTEPTTYKFRVALPDNGSVGYPYAPGASNTVEVHVAP